MTELLEACEVLPADALIDELTTEGRQLAECGTPLDSAEFRVLTSRLDHARCVRLSRVRRQWSFLWLHDLCGRYLHHLDWLEGALSHGPNRWGIVEGRGVGMDRGNDFRAFWHIAREIAGVCPLPKYPERVARLSMNDVRNEVGRLMDWCAEHHTLAQPVRSQVSGQPANTGRQHLRAGAPFITNDELAGRLAFDEEEGQSVGPLPRATNAFVRYLVETANLPPNTDPARLNEWQQPSPSLQSAALIELSPTLTPDEGERLNLRMRRLRTLAIACPCANLRPPDTDAGTAFDTFAAELEGFRGYVITLAQRLATTPVTSCIPPDTQTALSAGPLPADNTSTDTLGTESATEAFTLSPVARRGVRALAGFRRTTGERLSLREFCRLIGVDGYTGEEVAGELERRGFVSSKSIPPHPFPAGPPEPLVLGSRAAHRLGVWQTTREVWLTICPLVLELADATDIDPEGESNNRNTAARVIPSPAPSLATAPADPPAGAGRPQTPPDGPEGGRWVRWQGQRHEVPAGRVYALISHFWDRETASFEDLIGAGAAVWPDPVAPQTVTSTCHRVNSALPNGFPWRLSVDTASRTVARVPTTG